MLLLCSTDSSIAGSAALRVAADLAARLHAELACRDVDDRDRSRRLLSAAHATGCDLIVVGYASRSRIGTASPPGWQRRVVPNAPCPIMILPVGAVLPRGSEVMLGYDALELPHQAATAAGRLAGRLRTPLIITHVLGGDRTPRVPARDLEGRPSDQPAHAAAMHEAALVVIGGRHRGRGLLPRRSVARPPQSCGRLPVIVEGSRPLER